MSVVFWHSWDHTAQEGSTHARYQRLQTEYKSVYASTMFDDALVQQNTISKLFIKVYQGILCSGMVVVHLSHYTIDNANLNVFIMVK